MAFCNLKFQDQMVQQLQNLIIYNSFHVDSVEQNVGEESRNISIGKVNCVPGGVVFSIWHGQVLTCVFNLISWLSYSILQKSEDIFLEPVWAPLFPKNAF